MSVRDHDPFARSAVVAASPLAPASCWSAHRRRRVAAPGRRTDARTGLRPAPTRRRLGLERHVPRPRLRPRRGDEPVRRPWPRPGRPDLDQILAHYYQGATLGLDPARHADPGPGPQRVQGQRRPSRWCSTGGARPGRFDGSRHDLPEGRAHRGPTVASRHRGRHDRDLAGQGHGPTGAVLRDGHDRVVPPARRDRLDRLPGLVRTSTYDTYRGALRVGLKTTAPLASVDERAAARGATCAASCPAEMPSTWPTEALQAQAIAARSYAARRLRPGESYYDVPDDTSSQVYLGVLGEKARHDRGHRRRRPASCSRAARASPTRCSTRPAAARPSTTRTSTCRRRAKGRRAVSYLRGSLDRRDGRDRLRRRGAVRDVGDQDLHPGAAVDLVRPRQPRRTSGRSRRSTCATAACRGGSSA